MVMATLVWLYLFVYLISATGYNVTNKRLNDVNKRDIFHILCYASDVEFFLPVYIL